MGPHENGIFLTFYLKKGGCLVKTAFFLALNGYFEILM